MTKDEYLSEAARIHDEWVKSIRVEPDPKYMNNDPSQYAENAETVSASVKDERIYWNAIEELTQRYYAANGRRTSP
jgi:hypothetical protein